MKRTLTVAFVISLVFVTHADAQSNDRIELLNNADAIRARASLASGVPEDVVRASYPNAFPKYGPPGGPAEAFNNCESLINSPRFKVEINKKMTDLVEPLNALADAPESSRPAKISSYYFQIRDIYEQGKLAEQVQVRTSWEPDRAVLQYYIQNGINCKVSVRVKMNGTVQLNKNFRGRRAENETTPIIPVDLNYLTFYEAKGVKQASGETIIQVRGLKRIFDGGKSEPR
jgi:hypothetical protein